MTRLFSRQQADKSRASSSSSPHVVAMTSHFSGESSALGFCLSHDRRLRVWDLVTDTCLRTMDVAGNDSESLPPFSLTGTTHPHISVIGSTSRDLHLLVYLPAPLPTGSRFAVFELESGSKAGGGSGGASGPSLDEVRLVWQKPCDSETDALRAEMRGMRVYQRCSQRELFTLWDADGRTIVKSTPLDLEEDSEDDDAWQTIADASESIYSPLHGPRLDAQLADDPQVDPAGLFIPRIFEAGRFPLHAINKAIDSYRDNIISALANARLALPPVLTLPSSDFTSTAERIKSIVGCAVRVQTDATTGALQTTQYQLDLLKEWRAFVAQLDQADTQGRWAVDLIGKDGSDEGDDDDDDQDDNGELPLILALERILVPLQADAVVDLGTATQAYESILPSPQPGEADRSQLASAVATLTRLAETLREDFSPAHLDSFDSALAEVNGAPLPADLLDVVGEVWDSIFADAPISPDVDAVLGELANTSVGTYLPPEQAVSDDVAWEKGALESAFWLISDVLASCSALDAQGKASGHFSSSSLFETPLGVSLLADSTYQTLKARRSLAQSLTLLVVYIATQHEDAARSFSRLPEVLIRLMGTLHSLSVLVHTADTSTEGSRDATLLKDDSDQAQSIANQLQQLSVGSGGDSRVSSAQSDNILHALLAYGIVVRPRAQDVWLPEALSSATRDILTALGLSHVRQLLHDLPGLCTEQAFLAHRLLLLGFAEAASDIVTSYPVTSLGRYIQGKALVLQGRHREASDLFQLVLRGSKHDASSSSPAILPTTSHSAFYAHVANLFDRAECPEAVALFSKQALERRHDDDDGSDSDGSQTSLRDLYFRLFRANLSLGDFSACYAATMEMPDELDTLRRDCVRTLISTMCESGEASIAQLLKFTFAGLQTEVERNLSFKARNSDPTASPNYYMILYSYHVERGDYKSAGAVMYQQAHRLFEQQRRIDHREHSASLDAYVALSIQQARSYLAATNSLALLSPADAWFADAGASEQDATPQYIPAQHWQPESSNAIRIVQQADVKREYALVLARLELVQMYPELARSPTLNAHDAVSLFVRNHQFDRAFALARATGVDQSGIFSAFALKCADAGSADVDDEDDDEEDDDATRDGGALDFLSTCDRTSWWSGSAASKAWRYLRLNLEMEDAPGRVEHRVVTLERLLNLAPIDDVNGRIAIPSWLTQWFLEKEPELLVRAYLKSGLVDDALRASVTWVDGATRKFKTQAAINSPATGLHQQQYLPYPLFDKVLRVAADPDARPVRGSKSASETRSLAEDLKRCIEQRFSYLDQRWRETKASAAAQQQAREGVHDTQWQ